MVHRGHRPGGRHPSVGCALHDPHPAGALRRPLEYERCKGVYVLTRRKLDRAKKELLVMHPCPGWMKLPSTWTTIPGRSTSSRPATECTPAWPCSPIWPTRSGKTGAGGNRRQAGVLQPQLHHPDRALPASPGEAERRRGLLRLLRQGAAVKGEQPPPDTGISRFALTFSPILHILKCDTQRRREGVPARAVQRGAGWCKALRRRGEGRPGAPGLNTVGPGGFSR